MIGWSHYVFSKIQIQEGGLAQFQDGLVQKFGDRLNVDRSALVRAAPFDGSIRAFPETGVRVGGSLVHLVERRVNVIFTHICQGVVIRQDSHSNFPVIPCRCEHSRILRIPRYCIDATCTVALESCNKCTILLVPDVNLGIYT